MTEANKSLGGKALSGGRGGSADTAAPSAGLTPIPLPPAHIALDSAVVAQPLGRRKAQRKVFLSSSFSLADARETADVH